MRKLLIAALLVLSCCGCSLRSSELSTTFFAMDTIMDLKIYSENEEALTNAENEIKRIDALFDRGNPESEIFKINSEKNAIVSEETAALIKNTVSLSERTNGAFDITTAPLSDLWGFYGGSFRVPSDSEISKTLKNIGYGQIKIDGSTVSIPEGFSVDLGGIAKGYASDRAVKVLRDCGVSSAIISLGGNVHALGSKPDGTAWNVGITDPFDKSSLTGSVNVRDKAVVTSGGYQRYFEQDGVKYHHIIDPKTGKSADSRLSSVTIIADSGTTADALSTALFVMGLDKSAELWRQSGGFEAVFVDTNGSVYVTAGIADSFKSEQKFSIIK